eukprot:CAMPEP_0195519200 /NCGR_PEP_ID=MMETSP0794_2-20130614/14513_1 /TAXON_ID=515487 /ORGANISM="Stephanopyxis turris, Strain CCMP 815" /LENGTH=492 /DNA_ID=CAMNT_0040648319 /DNA_START=51 /DNA_END=1529 /DNA_ORIENTATION=-
MHTSFNSPSSSSGKIIIGIIASVWTLVFIDVTSSILKPRREGARRGKDIEIHAQDTYRNRRILHSAFALLSEPWGFTNRHFATILAQLRPSPFWGRWGLHAKRRIENILIPEGGSLEVEFVEPIDFSNSSCSETPVVIILHGINGSNKEPYIEQAALQIVVQKGWRAVILNYGKIRVLNDKMECALGGHNFMDGGDLNFLISHIRKTHEGFLGVVGYSMGGAKLVQYLGRTREHCNVDAACAISSPLDFTPNNVTVHNPVSFSHRAYHFFIASSLKFWIMKHYRELKKHPKVCNSKPFRRTSSGLIWWFQSNLVTDFDDAITIPAKGYLNLNQYYNDATVVEHLRRDVKIPLLILTSECDPIVPVEIIPGEHVAMENENIFIVSTKQLGGHCGFWLPGRGCWATRGCLDFFDSANTYLTPKKKSRVLRRQSSLKAARNLQRTSSTQLTDYFKLIAHDSFSNLKEDPATFPVVGYGKSMAPKRLSDTGFGHRI